MGLHYLDNDCYLVLPEFRGHRVWSLVFCPNGVQECIHVVNICRDVDSLHVYLELQTEKNSVI